MIFTVSRIFYQLFVLFAIINITVIIIIIYVFLKQVLFSCRASGRFNFQSSRQRNNVILRIISMSILSEAHLNLWITHGNIS